MAAKHGRRSKPIKARRAGCVNFKSNKFKMPFDTEAAANDYIKENKLLGIKEPYPCDVCDKFHIGKVFNGKQTVRSREVATAA